MGPAKNEGVRTRRVTEHPAPLGALAEIFRRRRIAVGTDDAGGVYLMRPDSVAVEVGDDPSRRERVAEVVARRDPRRPGR